MFPKEYRKALADAEALAKAEAAELQLLEAYAASAPAPAEPSSNGHLNGSKKKPKDAFDELKQLAAKATVSKPPRAITIKCATGCRCLGSSCAGAHHPGQAYVATPSPGVWVSACRTPLLVRRYEPKTPDLDFKRLQRDAAQGLPVKGMKPTWEANRPTVLSTLGADKVSAPTCPASTRCRRPRAQEDPLSPSRA